MNGRKPREFFRSFYFEDGEEAVG
eukprot:SAG31_NODE_43121_length_268_cov_0.917160_1_plen_23_part_01